MHKRLRQSRQTERAVLNSLRKLRRERNRFQVSFTSFTYHQFCHDRPRYFDGTRTHRFCSKACAKKAKQSQRISSVNFNAGASNDTEMDASCRLVKRLNTTLYTSLTRTSCPRPAETTCLMCRVAPKQYDSHFCSKTCTEDAEGRGPMILEVPVGHVTFKSGTLVFLLTSTFC